MEKKRLIGGGERDGEEATLLVTQKSCAHLLLIENARAPEEETIEFEVEEREESDNEESKIYDVWVQGERLVVSEEVRDALLRTGELLPSGCVWSVNDDFECFFGKSQPFKYILHESQSTNNTGPLHLPRIGTVHVSHAKVEISQRICTRIVSGSDLRLCHKHVEEGDNASNVM